MFGTSPGNTRAATSLSARFDAEGVTTEGASRQYIRVSDEGAKRATFHFCPDCGATVFYTTEATEDASSSTLAGETVADRDSNRLPLDGESELLTTTRGVSSAHERDRRPGSAQGTFPNTGRGEVTERPDNFR